MCLQIQQQYTFCDAPNRQRVSLNDVVHLLPTPMNRYDFRCLHWFRWQGSTGLVAFVFGELILQLRLYAMYLLNRRVLFFMAIAFISSVAASATLMGILLHNVVARANLIPGVPFCIPQNLPKNYYAFWIPMLASETILCVLAMWRGVESYYQKRNLFQSGQSLISLLIRDSLAYFLVLFAVYLINTIIFITGTTTQLESAVGYLVAMSCVMSNRMCLNVRGMVREDDDEDSSSPPIQFSRNNSARRRGRAGLITIGTGDSAVVLTEFEMDELRGLRVKR
ncbi:hypothetical protein ABKN59_005509 [Abortiporus biennis]